MGAGGWPARRTDAGGSTQASRPRDAVAAGTDVACDAGHRDTCGAPIPVVPRPLADSSWSDRRLRLPWEIFAELMRRALRPRATARQHRDAFGTAGAWSHSMPRNSV